MFRTAASALSKRQTSSALRSAARLNGGATKNIARSSSTTTPYEIVPAGEHGDFKEYSVIFTNRSLNLMAKPFQTVMTDLNGLLKETYNADKVAIIPGSGTFGMEAVARQFATDEHVMVIRNGWFSFRWTEIFDMGGENKMPKSHTVLKAKSQPAVDGSDHLQFAPYPVDEVVKRIYEEKPAAVFAPHVETSTGMILPDDYIKKVADAVHDVGGLFLLDCVASGTVWADMKKLGIDSIMTAPQKGWTGPACAALVMLSDRAVQKMKEKEETSFSISLKRWSAIMDAYEAGGFGYHTTMPTDALRDFHQVTVETMKFGMPELKEAQINLGDAARGLIDSKGLTSVAAPGFQAPGVLVYHSPAGVDNPTMMNRFKDEGLQIAMGVPWRIDEPHGLNTFRIGLFGLDKMGDIPLTVETMETALNSVLDVSGHKVEKEEIA